MQAWQVQAHGEPSDVLRLVELDEPTLGAGEMRVRVQAVAVGLPDVLMCRGSYRLTPPLPFVAGQEACGVVDAVGEGVTVPVGSRLMGIASFFDGRGGFAEAAVMYPGTSFPAPEWMDAATAAAFRIGCSTAWTGLVRRGDLQAGETLVVLGAAGGSGTVAIQLGRALGARVIAVAAGDDKLDHCRQLGADVAIDRTAGSVREAILAATDGQGADVVYDPVGGEVADEALHALAGFGRFLVVGYASGRWLQVNGGDLTMSNRSVIGVIAHAGTPADQVAAHDALLALAADGRLQPVTDTVPFGELPTAVEAVARGAVMGKLVVEVS